MRLRYKWYHRESGIPLTIAVCGVMALVGFAIYESRTFDDIFAEHCRSIGGTVLGHRGEYICIKDPVILERQ